MRSTRTTYNDKIATEEAVLGLTWTGGILDLRDKPETADVEYIIPDDGTRLLARYVGGARRSAASGSRPRLVINFIHEPHIQAIETETNRYATPNDAAKAVHRSEDARTTRHSSCPDDVMAKLEAQKDNSAITQRQDIWAEFKLQHRPG